VVTDYNASGMTGDWGWGEPVKKEERIAA